MKHICFVIGAMKYSGAEKVLSIIATELAKRKYKVSVILLEADVNSINTENGITMYGAKANGKKLHRILSRWKNIRTIINNICPDVIVSFGFVCNVNTVPALFGENIPLVLCERNDPAFDPRKKSEKFFRWLFYRFATGYVFQTEEIRKYFSGSIRQRAIVIPNPIIDSGIRWDAKKCSKSIATVARLDDFQKNHYVMFDAFKIFLKDNPEYTLDVYGDGPDIDNYKKYISKIEMDDKIFLHGKTSTPLNEIRKSEIFLLTSKFEGMPNALMEALSIGMPCVATNCGGGGAYELCSLLNSGIIVPVGDKKSIANALNELVHDKKKESEFSSRALSINKWLSKERIITKWEKYLLSLMEK